VIAPTDAQGGPFDRLVLQPADPLLQLIQAYRDDGRSSKLDLGVGVYRDELGATPVPAAVKAAEAQLLSTQDTKSYLGAEGDVGFLEQLTPLIFGESAKPVIGLQTPGGTGALRLAGELASAGRNGACIWFGTPTWPNHEAVFSGAQLRIRTYRHFDPATQRLDFEAMVDALREARRGDVILLHGCCHNPTGADLSMEQWATVAGLVAQRGLTPLIDLAYQGLGLGLDEDAAGARLVFDAAEDALLTYSCDKNFGLYRERTGALFARSSRRAEPVRTNMLSLARSLWSMPPDHGAAVVRLILESPQLESMWRNELANMRQRLNGLRRALADTDSHFAALAQQKGLFAQLPLSPEQVRLMREQGAVYMAGSGRINIAGLTLRTIPHFVQALEACLQPT
jgi:aromatic-amino-acid transaminase